MMRFCIYCGDVLHVSFGEDVRRWVTGRVKPGDRLCPGWVEVVIPEIWDFRKGGWTNFTFSVDDKASSMRAEVLPCQHEARDYGMRAEISQCLISPRRRQETRSGLRKRCPTLGRELRVMKTLKVKNHQLMLLYTDK